MLYALLLAVAPADAAEATYIPPFLRGDLNISYGLDLTQGSLVEGDDTVGRIATEEHRMHYGAVFGVAPGAAIFVEVPTYLRAGVGFSDSREMIFDPTLEEGSLANGDALSGDPLYEGSGLGGIWLGARGTPLGPAVWSGVGQRATTLLEFGYRLPNESNFWSVSGGERGAGPGASAIRLRGGFSSQFGGVSPYIDATWTRSGTIDVDLVDSDGEAATTGAAVRPPSSIDIDTGLEAIAGSNDVRGSSFAFDFRLGYAYYTGADVPSGLYLPDVLPTTDGALVTQSEYTMASVGLGLYYQIFTYMKMNVVVDGAYYTPRQIEHPYPVSTGMDTWGISGIASMQVMIRTPED